MVYRPSSDVNNHMNILQAIILGIVQVLAGTYFGPAAQQVSGYLLILLVLALRPQGLLGRAVRRA